MSDTTTRDGADKSEERLGGGPAARATRRSASGVSGTLPMLQAKLAINTSSDLATGMFGRKRTWSDQVADSALLQGLSETLASALVSHPTGKAGGLPASFAPAIIPSTHNPAILYEGHGSGASNSNSSSSNNNNSSSNGASVCSLTTSAANGLVKFVHSTMEILENQIKREEAPKKKRTRTTTEQLRILQKAFQADPMPNSGARIALAKRLGMNARAVQVWFQNRRAKEKLDAKRAELGLAGTSSFTSVRQDDSDNDGGCDESDGPGADDEEGEEKTGPVSGQASGDLFSSLRATGMLGRFAFGSGGTNGPVMKEQRSASTPNGSFHGIPGPNSGTGSFVSGANKAIAPAGTVSYVSSSGALHNSRQGQKTSLLHQHGQSSGLHHPLFMGTPLFPGGSLMDVNDASVDDLYRDLGTGSVPSPTDSCMLSSVSHIGGVSSGGSTTSLASVPSVPFFHFGDPFYGGGLLDRTPSVSPVGFGAQMHFFPAPGGTSLAGTGGGGSLTPADSGQKYDYATACRGPSGGNVYLGTSFVGTGGPADMGMSMGVGRRSVSLPEAHGNLTLQQLQHLENFGLQVFPSPLLSINEEDSLVLDSPVPESLSLSSSVSGGFASEEPSPVLESAASTKPPRRMSDGSILVSNVTGDDISSDAGIIMTFSDFLDGDVMR